MPSKSKKPNRTKPNKPKPYKESDFKEFVRYSAFPQVLREDEYGYYTDDAFARAHKMSRTTLFEWKKSDRFWDEIKETLKEWGRTKTPDVIMGLYRQAVRGGKAAEAKLWLQYFEDFKEGNETTLTLHRDALKEIQDNTRKLIKQESAKEREKMK